MATCTVMLMPSSLASSQSWRTTSGLQKPGPRVARPIVMRPVVGAEVLRPQPPRLVAVRGQHRAGVVRPEPPVHQRRVREAVREDRSDARLLQRLDRCVRVRRRVHDVRPVHERRDAGIQALEGSPQRRRVDVLRTVVRRELVEDRAEVGDQREVGRAGPDARLPGVAVRVDEPGDDDVAIRLDDSRPIGATGSARRRRSCRPPPARPRSRARRARDPGSARSRRG